MGFVICSLHFFGKIKMHTSTLTLLDEMRKEGHTSFSLQHFQQELENVKSLELMYQKLELKKYLQPYHKYVKGVLVVSYKQIKHLFKSVLNRKIQKSFVTGETICRKTNLEFCLFDKSQAYIPVEFILEMFSYGEIKRFKKPSITLVKSVG